MKNKLHRFGHSKILNIEVCSYTVKVDYVMNSSVVSEILKFLKNFLKIILKLHFLFKM